MTVTASEFVARWALLPVFVAFGIPGTVVGVHAAAPAAVMSAAEAAAVVQAEPARSAGAAPDGASLAIWKDPDFQRRFNESYLAETDIEPALTDEDRRHMRRIMELMAAEDIEGAMKHLERLRSPTSNAVFDFTLANIHFQGEDFSRASELYASAVEKFPRFRRAWRNLGLIHVRLNEWDPASAALVRVIELGGGDSVTYGLLGFAWASLDNNISAETAYRTAVLLDPATPDWTMGLARALFSQERFADASALCEILIRQRPERAEFWLLQANARIGMGQTMRAAENLEFVDRLGQSTAESLSMLADIYVNQELFDLAVGAYERAFALGDSAGPGRALRGARVLIARSAFAQTQQLLDGIDRTFADNLSGDDRRDMLRLRARIAVASGSAEAEARILQEIIELDPLDGEALILLGQYHARTGDLEQAVLLFERAAGLEQFEADARIRHAQALVNDGRHAEALPLLRRAQSIRPRESVQAYLEQVERASRGR